MRLTPSPARPTRQHTLGRRSAGGGQCDDQARVRGERRHRREPCNVYQVAPNGDFGDAWRPGTSSRSASLVAAALNSGIAHGLDRGSAHTANRTQLFVLTQPNPPPADGRPVRPRVAALLAVGCLIVAAFQAALTLGAPFGAAALGGANAGQLPGPLRLVTGFATVVWLLAALLVLTRGGSRHSPVTTAVASVGTWALACLLGVGALMNFASSSPWERFGWGPFTLVMFVLGVVLARSGSASDRPTRATGR